MGIVTGIVLLLICYLLGAVNPAIVISRAVYGKDVRTLGSGNAGSTNMYRNFGRAAGISTQVLDILKAVIAALLPRLLAATIPDLHYFFDDRGMEFRQLLCGLSAVCGHVWPVYYSFRGGKGVNSLLGMMLVVNPLAALLCLGIFIVVLLISHYVSLGSMIATLGYLLYVTAASGGKDLALMALGVLMVLLVVYTHRSNIGRLRAGNESKAGFLQRKKTS